MKKTKVLSCLVVLAVLMSAVPVSVFAIDNTNNAANVSNRSNDLEEVFMGKSFDGTIMPMPFLTNTTTNKQHLSINNTIGEDNESIAYDIVDNSSGKTLVNNSKVNSNQAINETEDTHSYQESNSRKIVSAQGGSLSISVWTDKSEYKIGETVTFYYKTNQVCTAKLTVTKPDGTQVVIGGPNEIPAGTRSKSATIGYPIGTRTVVFEAWAGDAYRKATCYFDVKEKGEEEKWDVIFEGTVTSTYPEANSICEAKIDKIISDPDDVLEDAVTVDICYLPPGDWGSIPCGTYEQVNKGDKIKVYGQRLTVLRWPPLISLCGKSSYYLKKIDEKKPDLIIQDISWSPSNPEQGDTITFTVTIKNQGSELAGISYLESYIDGNSWGYSVSPLSAGSTSTQTFKWTANNCGNIQVKAVADSLDEVDESTEENNKRTDTVSVTCDKPDLIIQDISWSPSNPKQGDTVTFTIKIKNQGSGDAGASYVEFCAGVGYIPIHSSVPALSSGSTYTWTLTWPADKCGDRQVSAKADGGNYVAESDEGNNVRTATMNVACPVEIKFTGNLESIDTPMGYTCYIFKIDEVLTGPQISGRIGIMVWDSTIDPGESNFSSLKKDDRAEVYAVYLGKQHVPWSPKEEHMGSIVSDYKYYVKKLDQQSFTFVHLTDPHIGADDMVESIEKFTDTLQSVKTHNPSFILNTGDIVDYDNPNLFKAYLGLIKNFDIPIYHTSGNHDQRNRVAYPTDLTNYYLHIGNEQVKQEGVTPLHDGHLDYFFNMYGYRFIGLDSGRDYDPWPVHDGSPEGSGIDDKQMERLNESDIRTYPKKIIFMHHPVINGMNDSSQFGWEVENKCTDYGGNDACIVSHRCKFIEYCLENNVDLVLTGHTHEDYENTSFNDAKTHKTEFIQTRSATKDADGRLFILVEKEGLSDLDNGIIPEKLKQEYKNRNIPLSEDVTIVKGRGGWIITDKENKNTYLVTDVGSGNIFLYAVDSVFYHGYRVIKITDKGITHWPEVTPSDNTPPAYLKIVSTFSWGKCRNDLNCIIHPLSIWGISAYRDNQHTGMTARGDIERNIPNSYYTGYYGTILTEKEPQVLVVYGTDPDRIVYHRITEDRPSSHTIQASSTYSPFNITIRSHTEDKIIEYRYDNVGLTDYSTAMVDLTSVKPNYIMEIDDDGDGITDRKKEPDSIEIVGCIYDHDGDGIVEDDIDDLIMATDAYLGFNTGSEYDADGDGIVEDDIDDLTMATDAYLGFITCEGEER